MNGRALLLGLLLALACSPLHADSARDILTGAAFAPSTKAAALARVDEALKAADAAIKGNPRDQNARLQRAMALSYRGKLNRSRSDLVASRKVFEATALADPRNPEAHMALAGWHLGAVIELGPLLARTMLGAKTAAGMKSLDRAVELGGDRPSIAALASLHRIQIDPSDVAGARKLAERAVADDAATPFDRVMQKQAAILLASLRKGNGKAAAAAAKVLMPFGRVK